MTENRSTDDYTIFDNSEVPISQSVRFRLLLILDISALICTLCLLFHLLFKRTLREALNNHRTYVSSYRYSFVYHFYSFELCIDIKTSLLFLLVVRFHSSIWYVSYTNGFQLERNDISFNFLLISVIISCILFYAVALFFPPCENVFDYIQAWCSYPCYYDNTILAMYDTVVNAIFSTLLIVILQCCTSTTLYLY
jgi:hypothetical protein